MSALLESEYLPETPIEFHWCVFKVFVFFSPSSFSTPFHLTLLFSFLHFFFLLLPWYSAEEGGLLGSQAVAQAYADAGKLVKAQQQVRLFLAFAFAFVSRRFVLLTDSVFLLFRPFSST